MPYRFCGIVLEQSNPTVRRDDVEISIVVPVFQEEASIRPFLESLCPILQGLTSNYEVIFCMDPGRDRTAEVIGEAINSDPRLKLLVMTRRWGQPACTMAGIENSSGRACIVMDVDLQDPPELIPTMYAKWKDGFEVVYAQRQRRTGETAFRLVGAYIFYWIVDRISEVKIPRNTGDFRLIDRKVVDHLRALKEIHGYLRGLVSYVGYRQTSVLFDRPERKAGRSNYSQMWGSLRIFFNGIVAFSGRPLTVATMIGMTIVGLCVRKEIEKQLRFAR